MNPRPLISYLFYSISILACQNPADTVGINKLADSIDNSQLSIRKDSMYLPTDSSGNNEVIERLVFYFTPGTSQLRKVESLNPQSLKPLFISYYNSGKIIKTIAFKDPADLLINFALKDSANPVVNYYEPTESDSFNNNDNFISLEVPHNPKEFHDFCLKKARILLAKSRKKEI